MLPLGTHNRRKNMNEQTKEAQKKPKGFFRSLMEEFDKKLKDKSKEKPCCGAKEKGHSGSSCCS